VLPYDRERDVLHLLALGHMNQEIGKQLFISVRTVDRHRAHIMRKLHLATRAQLVLFALANGLIGPRDSQACEGGAIQQIHHPRRRKPIHAAPPALQPGERSTVAQAS
jgi:DNA-binding CsgD family transcriptional regulator